MCIYYNPNDSFLIEIREWFKNNPIKKEDLLVDSEQVVVPWNKNKPWDEKTKSKISKSNKGRLPWNTGKVWSKENRYKIGKSRRKACSCERVIYDSPRSAALVLGLTRWGITYRIKTRTDYFFI